MASFNILTGAPGSQTGPFLDLSRKPQDVFNQFQGLGRNTDAAANVYNQLSQSLAQMFENYGSGQRAAINQRFDVTRNNALGTLARRGFSGSSLAPSTAGSVERDRTLSLGQFEDSLLGQRIGASQEVAKGLAGVHMGAADLSQRLREALLGLSQSTSQSGGGGGGGGGSSGGQMPQSPSFEDWSKGVMDRLRGGSSGGGGGGSGGGGGGSGGQSPSQPGFIENPFGQPKDSGLPDWSDPNKAKEMGGWSSTGPPGEVGSTYTVGGLTCVITANKGNHSERTCVPTANIPKDGQGGEGGQTPPPLDGGGPPASGGLQGDLGDYGSIA